MVKKDNQVLYFAYGSNLSWDQIRRRCPSARFLGVAELKNYRLCFPRKSQKGYGVASVEEIPGENVWGVVYQINEVDIGRLDAAEGYVPGRERDKNSYVREERHVYSEGNNRS